MKVNGNKVAKAFEGGAQLVPGTRVCRSLLLLAVVLLVEKNGRDAAERECVLEGFEGRSRRRCLVAELN